MKHILGLDLGTNSIDWAYVKEAQDSSVQLEIIELRANIIIEDKKIPREYAGFKIFLRLIALL